METWYVLHSRPRCEKQIAALLAREQISHELPLQRSVRRYEEEGRIRQKVHFKPLFPGYVFARTPEPLPSRVLHSDHLARAFPVPDGPRLAAQLEAVNTLIASGADLTPVPVLKPGAPVRICFGPLRGVAGHIHEMDTKRGIVVAVDLIQQGVFVAVNPDALEVLPA